MKVSPLAQGASGNPGTDIGNVNIGSTASAEKLAAAKALAQGLDPVEREEETDPRLNRTPNIRKITMRTNRSPERFAQPESETQSAAEDSTISDTSDGQTPAAVESTQPLSPQFAALAKQRRALQVKEREIAEREAKLSQPQEKGDDFVSKADLLSNPLKIFDLGVTHDQLTEAILSNASGVTPEIKSLKEELKRVKEDVTKTLTDREAQQEEQALSQMLDEAELLAKEGDDFELIRTENAYAQVLNKIYNTYKKTGKVLKVQDVMTEVENQLLERNLRIANINKVKSKLAPEAVQEQPQSQGKQMKTLTSRDGASVPLDRKARAMLAFSGQLRK